MTMNAQQMRAPSRAGLRPAPFESRSPITRANDAASGPVADRPYPRSENKAA